MQSPVSETGLAARSGGTQSNTWRGGTVSADTGHVEARPSRAGLSMAVARDTVEHESTLSNELLRQLMAVGQVDILVGLPTLNNAATVVEVARAIHACFTRDFARQRTV